MQGAAFVDYYHGMLWISATANDRSNSGVPRPYGPPTDHCEGSHWECNGVCRSHNRCALLDLVATC